jgi:hypothetical protein
LKLNVGVARAAIVGLLLMLSPRVADADWIFAPFIGSTFAGSTALPDLEQGASSTQLIFGGSAGLWTRGIFGVRHFTRRGFREETGRAVHEQRLHPWGTSSSTPTSVMRITVHISSAARLDMRPSMR